MKDVALKTAGVIFALVALLHLGRVIWKIQCIMGNVRLPMHASVVGFILASLLAVWMFAASKNK